MCGLAGQICFGKERTEPDLLKKMLIAQEARGKDSAGVAFRGEKGIYISKRALPPAGFVNSVLSAEDWKRVSKSAIVLMHARQATKGPPKDSVNNHPVNACGWVVTHNGHVSNDDDLIEYYGRTKDRPAAVDSVAINMALAQGETAEESLNHISMLGGTATFIAWALNKPDEIIIARVNGPQLFLQKKKDILYWSSDPDGMKVLARNDWMDLPFTDVAVMPQNTAFVINRDVIKKYALSVSPFRMPLPYKKPNPPPPKKNATTSTGGHHPLEVVKSNFPPTDLPIIGTPSPLGGATIDDPGIALKSTSGGLVDKFIAKMNGPESKVPLVVLSSTDVVYCPGDYKALAKPPPVFDPGVVIAANMPMLGGQYTTPYGTWYLTVYHRFFAGAKRVKAHWRNVVEKATGVAVHLPATAYTMSKFADKYELEVFHIKRATGEVFTLLMCPWCGIATRTHVWKRWDNTCRWCNVHSEYKP